MLQREWKGFARVRKPRAASGLRFYCSSVSLIKGKVLWENPSLTFFQTCSKVLSRALLVVTEGDSLDRNACGVKTPPREHSAEAAGW